MAAGFRINGVEFSWAPGLCGGCGFLSIDDKDRQDNKLGHCRIFNECHRPRSFIPSRCRALFKKAERIVADKPDDEFIDLAIVAK